MKRKTLKIASIILTVIMLCSTLCGFTFNASAEETAIPPTRVIDGKEFYELDSAEDLEWFVNFCNSSMDSKPKADKIFEEDHWINYEYHIPYNAILTGNITLNENVIVDGALTSNYADLKQHTPIANYSKYDDESYPEIQKYTLYTGIFDGNGYTISGLYINDPNTSGLALFRKVGADAIIKNVTLTDVYVSARTSAAGIAVSSEGLISNCTVDGIINVADCSAAGITIDNLGTIEKCVNYANVFGNDSAYRFGGITEKNYGTISGSINSGNIGNDENSQVGGISCSNEGTLNNCLNLGAVSGDTPTAGITAVAQPQSTAENCYYNTDIYSGPAICNNYTEESDIIRNVEGKTTEVFKSGEIAYLLGDAFGQNLSANGDDYPVFANENNNVYKIDVITCGQPTKQIYSNSSTTKYIHIDENYNGFCDICKEKILQFKLENGNLNVSYDAGKTWVDLGSIKGEQGEQGEKGNKGDQGEQGIQGVQGEKGDKGDQGEQGIQGVQGVQGEKGDKGDQGEQGIQGVQGEKGDKGDTGIAGTDGKDGADGKNGITPKLRINETTQEWEVSYDDGENWTSLGVKAVGENGKDGIDGKDGVDGKDANGGCGASIAVSALAIVSLLGTAVVIKKKEN